MIKPARIVCPQSAAEIRFARLIALGDIASMVEQGLTIAEAAAVVGITPVPRRSELPTKYAYSPTPERLKKACQEVRESWSKTDYKTRTVGPKSKQWELPSVLVADIRAAV